MSFASHTYDRSKTWPTIHLNGSTLLTGITILLYCGLAASIAYAASQGLIGPLDLSTDMPYLGK